MPTDIKPIPHGDYHPTARDLVDMAALYIELGLPHRAGLALDLALLRDHPDLPDPMGKYLEYRTQMEAMREEPKKGKRARKGSK